MAEYDQLISNASRIKGPKSTTMEFGPWTGGLVTSRMPERLRNNECAELLNFVITEDGYARTRNGLVSLCTGCDGAVCCVKEISVDGTWYTIIGTVEEGDPDVYRLYYRGGSGVVQIGDDSSLEGPPRVVGFNDLCMIFDGGYIKFWDGGSDIQMAYDDGLGTTEAFHFNNRYGQLANPIDFSPLALGDGTTERVAVKFTTQTWDADYTIPPTVCYATLCRKGDGYIGSMSRIWLRIRQVSDDAVIAEKETIYPDVLTADNSPSLDGSYTINYLEQEFFFTPDDLVAPYEGFDQNTEYYMSLEYDGGDTDNHIWVQGCVLTGPGYTHNGTAYAQETETPLYGVRTSRPPKAAFGVVHSSRLFCIEGPESDNPSYIWYSGAGNHLDWSSPNYGGWLDAGKPVGGIASYYDQIWVFGTDREPSLRRLAGATPSEYTLTDTMQKLSAHYDSITVTPDDIYFLDAGGVESVTNIQEFGDIRNVSQTDAIRDIVTDNYSAEAFTGYEPEFGLALLKLDDGTGDVYAIHTKIKTIKYIGYQPYSYSPISRWRFVLNEGESVTCFGYENGELLVGTSAGAVYRMASGNLADPGGRPVYRLLSSYPSTRFSELAAWKGSPDAYGDDGGTFDFTIYRNHSRNIFQTLAMAMPVGMTGDHPPAPAAYISNFDRTNLNFNFRSVMFGYENILTNGENPMQFGGIVLICQRIGGL